MYYLINISLLFIIKMKYLFIYTEIFKFINLFLSYIKKNLPNELITLYIFNYLEIINKKNL